MSLRAASRRAIIRCLKLFSPSHAKDVDLGDAHVDLEEMSVAEIVDDLTSVVLKVLSPPSFH